MTGERRNNNSTCKVLRNLIGGVVNLNVFNLSWMPQVYLILSLQSYCYLNRSTQYINVTSAFKSWQGSNGSHSVLFDRCGCTENVTFSCIFFKRSYPLNKSDYLFDVTTVPRGANCVKWFVPRIITPPQQGSLSQEKHIEYLAELSLVFLYFHKFVKALIDFLAANLDEAIDPYLALAPQRSCSSRWFCFFQLQTLLLWLMPAKLLSVDEQL